MVESEIQKQIEKKVTGGRGYYNRNIEDCLLDEVLNKYHDTQLGLMAHLAMLYSNSNKKIEPPMFMRNSWSITEEDYKKIEPIEFMLNLQHITRDHRFKYLLNNREGILRLIELDERFREIFPYGDTVPLVIGLLKIGRAFFGKSSLFHLIR